MDSPSQESDELLAARVRRGDAEVFGILVGRYEEKLRRYARRFLLWDEADDLVQDVFLKAYANIQSFDTSRRFSPWIYRIAHNEFLNAIKKRSAEPLIRFFDPDTLFPHPIAKEVTDRAAQISELKAMLDRHIGELDPKYREPLVLYYFEEKDYEEISDILNIPVSTVGVRMMRGKEMLKKRIKTHE